MDTLVQNRNSTSAVEDADAATYPELERRRQEVIRNFRNVYIPKTYGELHAASLKETKLIEQGLEYISLKEEDIAGWEKFWRGEAQDMMRSAHKLYHVELMDPLLQAYNGKPRCISIKNIREWAERFRNEEVGYKTKEHFVRNTLPGYIKNWKEVAEDRQKLLSDPNLKTLAPEDMPADKLKLLRNEEAFLDLNYKERKNLIDMARAAFMAQEKNMQNTHRKIKEVLLKESIGADRCLHPSKVGRWLRRAMECKTYKELKQFMDVTLPDCISNWRKVRCQYDTVRAEMLKNGVPPNFPLVTLDEFLWDHYNQRESYIEDAEYRLKEPNKQESKDLSYAKMRIRHNLYTKDWEGAEEVLRDLMSHYPDDRELRSLQRYLMRYRDDQVPGAKSGEKQKTADDYRGEIAEMMSIIPEPLHSIYEEALATNDPEVFERICQTSFNRSWCWGRGFLNHTKEKEEGSKAVNKETTKKYMEKGHSTGYENNILTGDTAHEDALRDECHRPQVVYVKGQSRDPLVAEAMVRKAKLHKTEKNKGWGYWTTLVTEIPYNVQHYINMNLNWKLKKSFRGLCALNAPYKKQGAEKAPTARSATVTPSPPPPVPAAREPHYAGKA